MRNGLFDEDAQQAWMVRKAEAGGFRILSVNSVAEGKISGGVKRDETTHNLTLLAVRFDGLLQVTDPAQLVEAVRHGIGSAKGFGLRAAVVGAGAGRDERGRRQGPREFTCQAGIRAFGELVDDASPQHP